MRTPLFSMLLLGVLLTPSCGDSSAAGLALRFSGIPDQDKAKLNANAVVLQDYLSAELGVEVKFVESASYSAAANGLASNKLDLAWLGGVTSVQAQQRSGGDATLVACRASDLEFKSYFIANREAIAAGRVGVVTKLEELKPMLAACTFTFGSKASTSGHIMPRHFMTQAGIDVHRGIKGGAKFQPLGGHSATLDAVANGAVDCGVLNYKVYEAADADTKRQAVLIYQTPTYVDYCMVAHNRLGKATIDKIRQAFIKLTRGNPAHGKVLDAFSATEFVAAVDADWDGIRSVLKTVTLE